MNYETVQTRQPRSELSTAKYRKAMAEKRIEKWETKIAADRELIAEMKEIILANGEAA